MNTKKILTGLLLLISFILLIQFSLKPDLQSNKMNQEPEMIFIQGGTFQMGDLFNSGINTEKPIHEVQLDCYYLQKTEVTVNEFMNFIEETKYITDAEKSDSSLAFYNGKWQKIKGVNWRYDATGKIRNRSDYNHPVVHVSWNDANAYCLWLSKKYKKNYRLSTEAEWEFAARNRGKKIQYSWGNHNPISNNSGNIADTSLALLFNFINIWNGYNDGYAFTSPVGCFKPNEIGLYDMTGNVWEWCFDWFDENYYANSPKINPKGPEKGIVKSFRGGCWFSNKEYLSISFHKFGNFPNQSYGDFGFRVALDNSEYKNE